MRRKVELSTNRADLIGQLLGVQAHPAAYEGAGGVARLYGDLQAWLDHDGHQNADMVRHGRAFLAAAQGHFIGYYAKQHPELWENGTPWGMWLETVSTSPDQALNRFFDWLSLFVTIHGRAPKRRKAPEHSDATPKLDVLDLLASIRRDPQRRPGNGSLMAFLHHYDQMRREPGVRLTEFSRDFETNIAVMLRVQLSEQGRAQSKTASVESLARALTEQDGGWPAFLRAVDRMHQNYRGMGQSQGGTRSLFD